MGARHSDRSSATEDRGGQVALGDVEALHACAFGKEAPRRLSCQTCCLTSLESGFAQS